MRNILLLMVAIFVLKANDIVLTKEEEKNWQIKTKIATLSNTLPLGTYMMEVTTPPSLLHAITLAFEAQVSELYVASYQSIKKGDLLAQVSGASWIQAQKEAISNAIILKESRTTASRKNRLCTEGVIPQKECISVNSAVQNNTARLDAAKAILHAYGADQQVINEIISTLKIKQTLPIKAQVSGTIIELNGQVGKSIDTSSPFILIFESGSMWLESDIPLESVSRLESEKEVHVIVNNKEYSAQVLQFSPVINRQNQTRHVRFSLPSEAKLLSGLRSNIEIIIHKPTLIVDKKSVIKYGDKNIVFVKRDHGYKSQIVNILADGDRGYYLEFLEELKQPIAQSSLATLKSMME